MGIHGLTKLLSDECPGCIKEVDLSSLTGLKVAIDASMAMYQFLIAIRTGRDGSSATMLMNESGEVTSHIQGMFNRTIRLLASGLKPIYVFDGKPPIMKSGELAKRAAKRVKAMEDHKEARENGTTEEMDKFSKRLVRVTSQHNEDCKTLLRLMGVPVIEASCEAEAQCAAMAKDGIVYAAGTEDMDALTFKTPKLLRKLTFAQNVKQPVMEVDYNCMITQLGISHEEFVDLCILCGCDYTDSIRGIGPKKALMLIRKYHSIEEIIKHIDRTKYTIPPDWIPNETSKKTDKSLDKKSSENDSDNELELEEEHSEVPTEDFSSTKFEDEDRSDEVQETSEEHAEIEDKIAASTKDILSKDTTSGSTEIIDHISPEKILLEVTDSTSTKVVEDKDLEGLSEKDTISAEVIKIPRYQEARRLFLEPDVFPSEKFELKWTDPNEEELTEFLVTKMQFNPERVQVAIKKIKDARKKGGQTRMDSFFKVIPKTQTTEIQSRPDTSTKQPPAKKAKTTGAGRFKKK